MAGETEIYHESGMDTSRHSRYWKMNRKNLLVGALTFHMTQALTGHGCFLWYLHRISRAASPRCCQCSDESDTTENPLFMCPLSVRLGQGSGTCNLRLFG